MEHGISDEDVEGAVAETRNEGKGIIRVRTSTLVSRTGRYIPQCYSTSGAQALHTYSRYLTLGKQGNAMYFNAHIASPSWVQKADCILSFSFKFTVSMHGVWIQ